MPLTETTAPSQLSSSLHLIRVGVLYLQLVCDTDCTHPTRPVAWMVGHTKRSPWNPSPDFVLLFLVYLFFVDTLGLRLATTRRADTREGMV